MRITKLDEKTINKIAAGEVIENPTSVLKELIDNAIDSGASAIQVKILGGGLHYIEVSDNGCGIEGSEIENAFERHATSKITDFEDLDRLHTMGFRGEALASIGAVAKVTLSSSTGKEGVKVVCEGGVLSKAIPAARTRGTTVVVEHLFFTTPVRKKFQKSPASIAAESTKLLQTFALAYPSIEWKYTTEDRVVFHYTKSPFPERIQSIFGKDFINNGRFIEIKRENCFLKGFIGLPSLAKRNKLGQYLFVQHRPIQSPLISSTIQEAFGSRIDSKEHPTFILSFNLPPHLVDVNVHPQKKEVRFANDQLVCALFKEAVSDAFISKIQTPSRAFFSFNSPSFEEGEKLKEDKNPPASFITEQKEEKLPLQFHPHVVHVISSMAIVTNVPPLGEDLIFYLPALEKVVREERAFKGDIHKLLIPFRLDLLPDEIALVTVYAKELEADGIILRIEGGVAYVEALSDQIALHAVSSIIEGYLDGKHLQKRGEIRSFQNTSKEYIQSLIDRYFSKQHPVVAPDGMLVWIRLEERQIEKLFRSAQ